ncbi:hypothetical protein SAMN02745166_02268 [Prosthecobacter debontii]|uniref:Uncharacterized protein n=1 Tax=Prosthecobacter debontii TaxID=48467 RepID=A0A1T4XZS4_9BACT|nr:hypothetical protein [Prosthecobacter debontii]SKA95087.1 hypothetical protein SAMN02745166_02268 [Prosthecobacter debontii]
MPDSDVVESLQLRSAELDMIMRAAPPPQMPEPAQLPLADLLADDQAQWAFSKDGANGAMLVRSANEPTGGAAIKVEKSFVANGVSKNAQMMEAFFGEATGEAPFAAPRVTLISAADLAQEPELARQLTNRLENLREGGVHDPVRVEGQIDQLKNVEQGQAVVVKMEFAQGQQINKMPLADRVALVQSDAFPQALGKSLPVFTAMGMNDHLGLIETNFKNNAANLMFDTETGQLSAIDFSPGMQFDPDNPQAEAGIIFSEPEAEKSIKRLNNFLERSLKDEASFEEAVQRMAEGRPTALTPAMQAFVQPMAEVHMFEPGDEAVVEEFISMEDKRRFAANLILGAAKGMDYLSQNEAVLRQATEQCYEQVNGRELQHIHSRASLEAMGAELQRVNGPELVAKAELHSAPLRLAAMNQQAGPLKVALDQANAKLDRLENKPSLKDRVNFLVKGRDEVIQQARQQQVNLQLQAEEMVKESHHLMNRQSEAQHQQAQAEKLKAAPNGVDGAPVVKRLRDDVAVADIAKHHPEGHHPVQDVAAKEAPRHLREEMAAERAKSQRGAVADDARMEIKTPKPNIPRNPGKI